jgi:REP-associated tyrosine transposase
MVFYRRNFIPGGTYFFTVALTDRQRDWLVRHINLLRLAFRRAKRERPFTIDAIVVLPEHLHCVWTLHRWRLIKARFSKDLLLAGAPIHQSAKGEYNV